MLKKLIALAIAAGVAGSSFAAADTAVPPKAPKAHHMKVAKHHHHQHAQRHHQHHMASAQ